MIRIQTNGTFYRPLVTSAQCIIGTEKYPHCGNLLNFIDEDYSQGCSQIKETVEVLVKDDVLQPYISDNDFRSSNDGNNICYKI